jgi:predicted RNase H-like HicB family nuclease
VLAGSVAEQPLKVELEQEADGRWLAEVIDLPGVLAYGVNREEALAKAAALALRVIADRLEPRSATGMFAKYSRPRRPENGLASDALVGRRAESI